MTFHVLLPNYFFWVDNMGSLLLSLCIEKSDCFVSRWMGNGLPFFTVRMEQLPQRLSFITRIESSLLGQLAKVRQPAR
jgi:hypothetical protein